MDEPDLRGTKTCVIGASGFVGRHTVAAFAAAGSRVSGLSRSAPVHDTSDAIWLQGDVQDERTVEQAVEGCDFVIYLASTSLPASANADMAAEVRHHVHSPVRAAELAVSRGVRKFVFASSGGTVYGVKPPLALDEDQTCHPLTAYAVSKLAVESYLRVMRRLHDLGATSLRIANPYGEYQTPGRGQGFVSAAMKAAFAGSPLRIWGDGSVVRDYVYVGDVAWAFVRASLYEGEESVFNIGSSVGRTLMEVVSEVETAAGRRIPVLLEPRRTVDVPVNILATERAHRHLGWTPQIGFSEGLRRTVDWWSTCYADIGLLENR